MAGYHWGKEGHPPLPPGSKEAMSLGKRILQALDIADDFEKSMARVADTVNTSADQMRKMERQVINMAVDQQVLELYRYMRISAGRTDHKKLLKQERFRLGLERAVRLVRKGGAELGWLFGLDLRWEWPRVQRPYDWESECRW